MFAANVGIVVGIGNRREAASAEAHRQVVMLAVSPCSLICILSSHLEIDDEG